MAWAFVSGAASKTKTVSKSVTAGNLLTCGFGCGDGTSTPTISDGVNTWTPVSASPIKDVTNATSASMWSAIAATTTTITITITAAATTFNGTWIMEHSGNAASSPNDGSAAAANIAGSTATDGQKTGSFTPSTNGDLIICFIIDDENSPTVNQFTAGTGFTERTTAAEDPAGASDLTYSVEDMVQATAVAINPSWTAITSKKAVGIAAAFKPFAAGGGTNIPISLVGEGGGFAGRARGWAA